MTDDELIRGFEAGSLAEFPHASHVRVSWWYLRREPILLALASFRSALQRFAAAKGKPDMYHETVTVAYVLLIAERLDGNRDLTWEEFAARNPDLLKRHPSPLTPFYSPEVLRSAQARERFVMAHDRRGAGKGHPA